MEWPATRTSAIAIILGVLLGGCTEKPKDISPFSGDAASIIRAASRSDHGDSAQRSMCAKLPPTNFVGEEAIGDFGMSIATNFEVGQGGKTEWVLVDDVFKDGSASRMGIRVGDRILAIDGRKVAEMKKDELCALFFQRRQGESIRLLVLRPHKAVLDFVTLVASPSEG